MILELIALHALVWPNARLGIRQSLIEKRFMALYSSLLSSCLLMDSKGGAGIVFFTG